jgi:hypothetical protein
LKETRQSFGADDSQASLCSTPFGIIEGNTRSRQEQ